MAELVVQLGLVLPPRTQLENVSTSRLKALSHVTLTNVGTLCGTVVSGVAAVSCTSTS